MITRVAQPKSRSTLAVSSILKRRQEASHTRLKAGDRFDLKARQVVTSPVETSARAKVPAGAPR